MRRSVGYAERNRAYFGKAIALLVIVQSNDRLKKNSSLIQPKTLHADTQGAERTAACDLRIPSPSARGVCQVGKLQQLQTSIQVVR
ncbi:MAG: hypothetical protein ACRC1Z_23070 [Waterburya sp.]